METDMRRTNNGAAPTLRQEGRSMRTSYSAWALEDAALEVMDDPPPIRSVRLEAAGSPDPRGFGKKVAPANR